MGARRRARRMSELWEVFRQERKGQPFEHAGSVVAPDADFAEAWAREQYGRRGESVALWLVPRDAIRDVDDWADEFDLKYRRVDGYSIKARLKEARERAGTARAWLTTSSSSAGATPSGRASRRCSRRTSRSRRSRRTRSATRARSTSSLSRTTPDALAFDRTLDEYRCAPLVELHLLDWAHTIARRWLYEVADEIRIAALKDDADPRGRGPRGEDRPRGGVPPHARRDVARPAARRAALPGGGRGAVAVRARRPARRAARRARRSGSGSPRSTRSSAGRTPTSSRRSGRR